MFDDDKIEVHTFGISAKRITPAQLKELGEAGYYLLDAWKLNVEDYGPGMSYYIFGMDY